MKTRLLFTILLPTLVLFGAMAAGGGDTPENANRAAVSRELGLIAARAQRFYRTPAAFGGGQGSFDGSGGGFGIEIIIQLTSNPVTSNGSYTISTAATRTSIGLTGYGTHVGNDGNPIEVDVTVFPDSVFFNPLN